MPLDEAALRSLVPAVDQLASVFSEVRVEGRASALAALPALVVNKAKQKARVRGLSSRGRGAWEQSMCPC